MLKEAGAGNRDCGGKWMPAKVAMGGDSGGIGRIEEVG